MYSKTKSQHPLLRQRSNASTISWTMGRQPPLPAIFSVQKILVFSLYLIGYSMEEDRA